ncbi:diacylglycerol kinase family protein [Enemella sp. A6]|uniref:diacylglycerol kinase family protein n=1 Tax=Enemella sp. A6 TaxID=3440152 RepID=UPI003EB6CDB1
MAPRAISRFSLLVTVGSLLAFVVWTLLVGAGALEGLDRRLSIGRPPALTSPVGQIASAIAVFTHPFVIYPVLLILAVWAWRRRLRLMSWALLFSLPIGALGRWLIAQIFARPRPDDGLVLITQSGFAYPSGHVTATTMAAILITATVVVTRQSTRVTIGWRLGGVAVIALVGFDRWVLGAHWFSDLIGGLLFGAFAATSCLVLAGVKVVPPELTALAARRSRALARDGTELKPRCAVILNPSKVTDEATFRRHVHYELSSRGWARPIWLETTPEDPGAEMTEVARRKEVDLVLGAGGDGTIRAICNGLAGTGISFGLIPAGTGNLLAKNLGIPLDERAALELAFEGTDHPIDLVSVRADGGEPEYFGVMAGIGVDAAIISGTNPDLKKAVGSAAYFVAAAQHANHAPQHTTFEVDGGEPFTRLASVVLVGNVGNLQGGIPLIPDAAPDDGLMDLLVASPSSARDWVKVVTRVMTRQRRTDERLDRFKAKRIVLRTEHPDAYQLDGDTRGTARELEFEIHPGALQLRM